jgi:dTDP-4-dehydrorhamnose reductase
MYSLEDIYNQAEKDRFAVSLDNEKYKSKLVYGVKITKDKTSNEVEILNTMIGGDYYCQTTRKELEIFLEKGWRYGVYVLSLSNLRSKLDLIEERIKEELTGKNSQKKYKILKNQREKVLEKYSQLNYKLNQIK